MRIITLILSSISILSFFSMSQAKEGDVYNCIMDKLTIVQNDCQIQWADPCGVIVKEGKLKQFKFEFTGTALKFKNKQDKFMEFELKLGEFSDPKKEIYRGHHPHGAWKYKNGKLVISNVLFGYGEVVFASCSKL